MNPSLIIKNPFSFQLEIESSTSSPKGFRCIIGIEYEVYRRRVSLLISDNWFEEVVFDDFVESLERLKKGERVEAKFYDCDRELIYKINDETVQLEINRYSIEDNLEIKLEVDSTPEIVALTLEALAEFPKWW